MPRCNLEMLTFVTIVDKLNGRVSTVIRQNIKNVIIQNIKNVILGEPHKMT